MSNSIPLSDLESSPSAKFTNIGDAHAGRIVAIDRRQQTDIAGKPRTFNDGTAMMQWVITIQLPSGENVNLYAKGGKFKAAQGSGESMLSAIGAAVRTAGAQAVDIGGELAVQYTGLSETVPGSGKQAAKLYVAQYRPPSASIPVADLFSQ